MLRSERKPFHNWARFKGARGLSDRILVRIDAQWARALPYGRKLWESKLLPLYCRPRSVAYIKSGSSGVRFPCGIYIW